ncbi:hypothetical protein HYC85_023713 [Camellia sinensis]|uniref:Uncharacterized protein n=1 Tax=Camellia sinensis TaxID=4442 RepID=A0A7J7GJ39_CAMSI|nr:hypothetical protein HYC85_023713 [Camellia sinensis]
MRVISAFIGALLQIDGYKTFHCVPNQKRYKDQRNKTVEPTPNEWQAEDTMKTEEKEREN